MPLAVFCDFDGTFARQDVGSTIAQRHAADRRPALWERLERGELNAWDYNLELLDRLPLPEAELDEFLRTIELDPGAKALVAWCEERGVPFRVLSDGFDYNLDRLQQLNGVRFAYDANRLWYERDRWRIAREPSRPELLLRHRALQGGPHPRLPRASTRTRASCTSATAASRICAARARRTWSSRRTRWPRSSLARASPSSPSRRSTTWWRAWSATSRSDGYGSSRRSRVVKVSSSSSSRDESLSSSGITIQSTT